MMKNLLMCQLTTTIAVVMRLMMLSVPFVMGFTQTTLMVKRG